MSYLLGIDIGSTSLKAVAFDAAGNEKASAARPTALEQQDAGHPTWMVMPPDEIWAGIADAIADVVQDLGDAGQIAALAVTGMGHDGVPVDAESKASRRRLRSSGSSRISPARPTSSTCSSTRPSWPLS